MLITAKTITTFLNSVLHTAATIRKAATKDLFTHAAISIDYDTIISIYSKSMKGVDQRDASLHPYSPARKSYFTKIGVHFIQLLIKNAFKNGLFGISRRGHLFSTGPAWEVARSTNRRRPTKRCRQCWRQQIRKETVLLPGL